MSEPAFLFDSSVWVALTFDAHPAHRVSMNAFAFASADRPACFCRSTQQSYLRLVSTPALLHAYGVPGLTNEDTFRAFDALASHPSVAVR